MEAEEEEEETIATAMEEFPDGSSSRSRLPFARGGPIYSPDLIGPLTSVFAFKADILQQLQGLEAELTSAGDFDDELSVIELKVFTEEELVERALKEDFQGIPGVEDTEQSSEPASEPPGIGGLSQSPEQANEQDVGGLLQLSGSANEGVRSHSCISGKEIVCSGRSTMNECNSGSCTSLDIAPILTHGADISKGAEIHKKKKKRGRYFDRDSRAAELDGIYFTKVKQFAKLKQKQDEDKLAARLHSFSGNSNPDEEASSTSEKIEKLRSLRFITDPVKVKSRNSQEHVPLCYPEVVLCVEIYDNKITTLKTQEFLLLEGQSLTDLRDSIYCLTDKVMQTAGEYDPSGYFLIEDTFCNDLRDSSSIDYSQPIFEWLTNSKTEAVEKWEQITSGKLKRKQQEILGDMEIANLPNFKAVNMHRTRMSDLKFRLGARYLYCHQGNCKHFIVVRDMRLIHPDDVQNRADYPLLTFQLRRDQRKCSVCGIYLAKKMTVDDKWAPENPCYFCINCYFLLHYKEDNSLLYPHVVFDYYKN